MLKKKGFTLIELVIVIIILSAVGIATSSYIATGVDIYTDISERDKGINSTRFVMERLRREVSNALPNSAVVESGCLKFSPILTSTIYGTDFPIFPDSKTYGNVASLDGYSWVSGDQAVVYLLAERELADNEKIHPILGVSATNEQLLFSVAPASVNFSLASPAKRLYIIRDTLRYCFSGNNLYRSKNTETPILMAEDIGGTFMVQNATLQRNSLVQVNFELNFDGQEVSFEQTIHINNTP